MLIIVPLISLIHFANVYMQNPIPLYLLESNSVMWYVNCDNKLVYFVCRALAG